MRRLCQRVRRLHNHTPLFTTGCGQVGQGGSDSGARDAQLATGWALPRRGLVGGDRRPRPAHPVVPRGAGAAAGPLGVDQLGEVCQVDVPARWNTTKVSQAVCGDGDNDGRGWLQQQWRRVVVSQRAATKGRHEDAQAAGVVRLSNQTEQKHKHCFEVPS